MRGHIDPQVGMFSYFSVEAGSLKEKPMRRVRGEADSVLA